MSVKVGVVGARGLSFIQGLQANKHAEVVALCDINEDLLEHKAKEHGIPRQYRVYEDMLESDVDAVVVSTPMQLHIPQTLQALDAGKHVLCEVTAGVSMEELWWLKEWAEKSSGIYMFAENYCYIPENQIIRNMVGDGLFGEVYFGEGEYLHETKHLSAGVNYHEYAGMHEGKTSWRRFWQLGRRGTFYPTHSLGPVMQWFKGDRIASVSCLASGWHTDPRFRQEDTSVTLCKLASGKLIKLRVDAISMRPHNMNYYTLQGTKGCYEAPRGFGDDHKVWLTSMDPDTESAQWRGLREFEQYLPERYQNVTKEQRKTSHWGADFFIVDDFIDAIVNNTAPPIDVYDACEWTAVGLLSEISVQNNGRPVKMPDFRGNTPLPEQFVQFVR